MKKLFVIALLAVAAMGAKADPQSEQKFSVTPHIGFGYAHLSNLDKCSNGGAIVLGAESQYLFNSTVGMSAGIDFSYIQSQKDTYSTVGNLYLTTAVINIPVLAQFHVGDHVALKAGVQPGFLIEPKLHGLIKASSTAADIKIKDYTNNFQLSIPVGVSYEFNNPLVLDLRANIPVTKILDKDKFTKLGIGDPDNVNMFTVTLTVGYRFDIDD